jgi:outer membrane protein assembly factor BamB
MRRTLVPSCSRPEKVNRRSTLRAPWRAAVVATAAASILTCWVGTRPASAQAPGWARPDLKPVTQPAVVGNRVVVYVAAGGGLRVVALDAGTGQTVWSYDASTSEMAPGEAPYLTFAGGNAIYLAKRPGSLVDVTAVDVETGTERWRSEDGYFTGSPGPCPDAPAVVCISGQLQSFGSRSGQQRFDAATGSLLAPVEIGDSPRDVGDGLFDPGDRDPERLVATSGNRVRWSRPLAAVFSVGLSTDYGWNFSRFDRLGLFVGSVGSPPRRRGKRDVFNLSPTMTAAFRIANGRTKWRRPGEFQCSILPCPGADETGYATSEQPAREPRVGLRLVARGTWSFPADPAKVSDGAVSRDARAVVQGFALSSGRTLWSFEAGRNVGLIRGTLLPPRTGADTIVIRDARGRLRELNLERGTRREAPSGTVGWCRTPMEYRQSLGYEIDGTEITDYTGQLTLFPCAAATSRRVAVPAQLPAFLGDIGARSGNLIIWSDTSGVSAAPVASA